MARLALHSKRSVERVCEAIDDGESQSRAARLSRQAAIGLPEGIENAGLVFSDDADSRVHHLDAQA